MISSKEADKRISMRFDKAFQVHVYSELFGNMAAVARNMLGAEQGLLGDRFERLVWLLPAGLDVPFRTFAGGSSAIRASTASSRASSIVSWYSPVVAEKSPSRSMNPDLAISVSNELSIRLSGLAVFAAG